MFVLFFLSDRISAQFFFRAFTACPGFRLSCKFEAEAEAEAEQAADGSAAVASLKLCKGISDLWFYAPASALAVVTGMEQPQDAGLEVGQSLLSVPADRCDVIGSAQRFCASLTASWCWWSVRLRCYIIHCCLCSQQRGQWPSVHIVCCVSVRDDQPWTFTQISHFYSHDRFSYLLLYKLRFFLTKQKKSLLNLTFVRNERNHRLVDWSVDSHHHQNDSREEET